MQGKQDFLNDKSQTTRKQRENADRRRNVARIISYLQINRGARTIYTIREATGIDLASDIELRKDLESNDKVIVSGNSFQYKPCIENVHNSQDLCRYLSSHPEGVTEEEIKDAYVGCENDLLKLQEKQRIIAFKSNDGSNKLRLFWFPGRIPDVDDNKEEFPELEKEMIANWNDIRIPYKKADLIRKCDDCQLSLLGFNNEYSENKKT